MGWMKEKTGMWGDDPQDVMDDAIEKRLGKQWYKKVFPLAKAKAARSALLKDNKLRARIDRIYQRAWKRKATASEYRRLIWGIRGSKAVRR